jgi:hypothetical protein
MQLAAKVKEGLHVNDLAESSHTLSTEVVYSSALYDFDSI